MVEDRPGPSPGRTSTRSNTERILRRLEHAPFEFAANTGGQAAKLEDRPGPSPGRTSTFEVLEYKKRFTEINIAANTGGQAAIQKPIRLVWLAFTCLKKSCVSGSDLSLA